MGSPAEREQRSMQSSKLYRGALANMLLGMFLFTSFTAGATDIKVGLLRSFQNGACPRCPIKSFEWRLDRLAKCDSFSKSKAKYLACQRAQAILR
jgi:hypothetical protein